MSSSLASPPEPITPQQAAAELLRRRNARRSLLGFASYTFPDYAPTWYHRVLCDHLDRFVAGELPRLMIQLPPQHGKSELVSRRLPAYLFGRFPDDPIVHASYTADLVTDFSYDIQTIMRSDAYAALFPGVTIGRAKTDDWRIEGRRGRYRCAGTNGGISGRSARWLIADDLIKGRNSAESPTERERVWRWIGGDFLTRAGGDARILVMGTPWHPDDPMGRFLAEQAKSKSAHQWTVLKFPAQCETLGLYADRRQLGEYLWPERFGEEHYVGFRESFPNDWASLYQLRPRGAGLTEWPDEFFGPHLWFDDWPACPLMKVMSLDPSKGRSDKAGDFSAFISLGIDQQMCLWVDADLDNTRTVEGNDRGGRSIVDDGLRLYNAFRPRGFVIETNGFQELVAAAFARVAKARNMAVPFFTRNNTEPKVSRIRTVGTYLAQRRLRVRNTKGGRLLVQQLREFPTGLNDDGPDALALAIELADYFVSGRDEAASGGPQLLRT